MVFFVEMCVYNCQISTRNLVQVRTHAQKYFQKLQKNVNCFSLPSNEQNANKGSLADCRKKYKEIAKTKTKEGPEKQRCESGSPISVTSDPVISPVPAVKIEIAIPKIEPKVENAVFIHNPVNCSSTPYYSESYPFESDLYLDILRQDLLSRNNLLQKDMS